VSKTKVYYLDDEPDLLDLFSHTFTSPEVEVKTFTDASEFTLAVQAERPDVVFLDFRLSQSSGYSIAQNLDPSIRKVLITGDASVTESHSFERVFEKPYSIPMIKEYLKNVSKR
jgi:DNA-binding NtrC family response regulator